MTTDGTPLRFYRVSDPHGWASNFAPYPIVFLGLNWPTSEHLFQAWKFVTTDPDYADEIRRAISPKVAAAMGRDRSRLLRPDWEEVKDDVMRFAVLMKLIQHPKLQAKLLATGDRQIIEATTYDYYWGEGTNGTGKNMLGVILMEHRDLLRQDVGIDARLEAWSKGELEERMIHQSLLIHDRQVELQRVILAGV